MFTFPSPGILAKLTAALKRLCDHLSWLRAGRNTLATRDLRCGSGYGVGLYAVDVRGASATPQRIAARNYCLTSMYEQ
jgi:hypothetical protein